MWRNILEHWFRILSIVVALLTIATASQAQMLSSSFSSSGYSLVNLGPVPTDTVLGSLGNYGGITLKSGEPSKLLVGVNALTSAGRIVQADVTRNSGGHITGILGTTSFFATAGSIDGGLAYNSSGVLFATSKDNLVYQFKTGSTTPDKTQDVSLLTGTFATGSINFVPQGYHGAGEARISTYTTSIVTGHSVTPDGSGTFTINTNSSSQGLNQASPLNDKGTEAINWVPIGSAVFDSNKQYVIVNEFNTGTIAYYEWILSGGTGQIDVNTRQVLVSGITNNPNGGFIDPTTGDYLFTTFGSGSVPASVWAIRGFAPVPEPTGILAASAGVGLVLGYLRRRKQIQPNSDQPAVA